MMYNISSLLNQYTDILFNLHTVCKYAIFNELFHVVTVNLSDLISVNIRCHTGIDTCNMQWFYLRSWDRS